MPYKLHRIKLDDLTSGGNGAPVARGGRGVIYSARPKKMLSPEIVLNGRYLLKCPKMSGASVSGEAIASHLDQINRRLKNEYSFFKSRLALPLAVVENKGQFLGYLMPEFTQGCYFKKTYSDGEVKDSLRELKVFLNKRSERDLFGVPNLEAAQRLAIVVDMLETLAKLHENGLVVGDLSGSNLVVQDKSARKSNQRVIFLDVDSFSYPGGAHPLGSESTIHWRSPEELTNPGAAPTRESDVYKAGLVIIRLLHQVQDTGVSSFDIYKSKVASRSLQVPGGQAFHDFVNLSLGVDSQKRPRSMALAFHARELYRATFESAF